MPLTYHQANINQGTFPEGEFDLVVNHAAAHHIAAIDRVFREVCRILPDDGWFVSFDYVGPHRNQYRLDAWEEAWQLNHELPESLRQDLDYPPMPVMLVVDPTEAVHSELIVETFHRYFSEGQFAALGGAIAYPLLTHNARMFDAADDAERARWIKRIIDADDDFLTRHPESDPLCLFHRPTEEGGPAAGRIAAPVGGGRGPKGAACAGERRRVLPSAAPSPRRWSGWTSSRASERRGSAGASPRAAVRAACHADPLPLCPRPAGRRF